LVISVNPEEGREGLNRWGGIEGRKGQNALPPMERAGGGNKSTYLGVLIVGQRSEKKGNPEEIRPGKLGTKLGFNEVVFVERERRLTLEKNRKWKGGG